MTEPTDPRATGDAETSAFARELARGLDPVRRMPRLRTIAAAVSLVALCISALIVIDLGLRSDVRSLEMGLPYLGVLIGLLLFALGGLLAALGTSVPGREAIARAGLGALVLAATAWLLAAGAMAVGEAPIGPLDGTWMGTSLACLGLATGVGFIPAIVLLSFIVGAFPYRPGLAVGIGGAAMVAFGSGAVHLTCASDEIMHVALGHVVVPLAAGAVIGFLFLALRRSPARS